MQMPRANVTLQRLRFFADSLARLSFQKLDEVAEASASIVHSVLRYETAIVVIRDVRAKRSHAAGAGVNAGVAGSLPDSDFLQHLWQSCEAASFLSLALLPRNLSKFATELGISEQFLVAPVRVNIETREKKVGLVITCGAPGVQQWEVDLASLDLVTSLMSGSILSAMAREELLRKNLALERSNRLLSEKEAEASQATRTKSEFLANVSHEIRTPLTSILGFAETLKGGDGALDESERLEAVDTIIRNGEHLLGVINDILDLSKVEAGKLDVDRMELSPFQIVLDVMSLLKVKADAKGIALASEFQGTLPEVIQSDPVRLRQILVNLIGNAIKFTEVGSVTLRVSYDDRHDAQELRFQVIDTGIGIKDDQFERLFQPFTQADTSTSRHHQGTGLGLSISQRLANLLEGYITLESHFGQGSTFCLHLATGPLKDVPLVDYVTFIEKVAKARKEGVPTTPGKLDCRILLVEDGPDNQRLVSFVLRKAGAEVDIAENGEQGCEMVFEAVRAEHPYDVVLMDMQMPVLDGYAATQKLRESGYSKPIIALTANAQTHDKDRCLKVGCDAFTTKPIDRRHLFNLIAMYQTT